MMLSGEQSLAIDYAMSRNFESMSGVHGPANHARTHLSSQVTGDRPVTGHTAFRDEFYDSIYIFEKVMTTLRGRELMTFGH